MHRAAKEVFERGTGGIGLAGTIKREIPRNYPGNYPDWDAI
jgi:hypothetical protein